jgi:ribonuclease D
LYRYSLVGLSHLTKAVLGKPLDKSVRMSDWSKRPLTPRQTHYAGGAVQVAFSLPMACESAGLNTGLNT